MKQSSKRLASIGLALLFVVAALVMLFDIVQPEYGNVAQVKGTIAGENEILQSETQAVTSAQNIIKEYQQQSQGQGMVDLAIPTTQDLAGALAQIYGLAQNNGLTIQGITISSPTLEPGSPGSQPAGNPTTPGMVTMQPLGTFSFQIAAAGSYESLKNFLAGMETNVRVFDLKGLSIAPGQTVSFGKGAPAPSQDLFSYNITVATYYQTN